MSECQRGGDGSEQDEAAAATIPHARARDAEGRVAATTGTRADAESLSSDRIAEARLAEVDPERSKVDGFAVEKAHLKEVEGRNLLNSITRGGSNRGVPRKNLKKFQGS